MGKITGYSPNKFVSADFIYSKIKREFKSFAAVNLLDDMDFPAYTMEVLRQLGNGAMRESDAIVVIHNQEALLPKDFKEFHAAYRCSNFGVTNTPNKLLQSKVVFETSTTEETFSSRNNCEVDCTPTNGCRVTVRQYINEDVVSCTYGIVGALRLTPNVRKQSDRNSTNLQNLRGNEITIDNDYIFTNFVDDAIYLQYYAFPYDEQGLPMIPDNIETEKAVEWHIKHEILLNFWLVDDLANALNKWQMADAQAEKWMAAARHLNKLPAFSTLVNYLRDVRGINKLQAFSNNNRQ